MTNYNGNFIVDTEVAYVGMGFPVITIDAEVDKARSFGSAVKLVAGNAKKYPFSGKMADAGAAADVDGIIMMGVNYDETGKAIVGKTEKVMTQGVICVQVEADAKALEIGADIKYNGGKFEATSGDVIGKVVSAPLKAKTLESGALVDALYIKIGY